MKIKSKGKVHPSPSSSTASSSSAEQVILSVFQLLPAAILALAAVLSLEDREVLAYMVTRSMKTTTTSTSVSSSSPNPRKSSSKKSTTNNNKKQSSSSNGNHHQHNPSFDCECFDCYRSYWFKWDSSPNRELIHQAIEAFEDHLAHGEKPNNKNGRSKRRDNKMGRHREAHKSSSVVDITPKHDVFTAAAAEVNSSTVSVSTTAEIVAVVPSSDVVSVSLPERIVVVEELLTVGDEAVEESTVVVRAAAVSNHKGLVRKVLPDVLGLFNSRLWSLWSPNA